MPKHIKILKHPETRKFYVSDVCEFHSVEVCFYMTAVALLSTNTTVTLLFCF